MAVLNQDRGHAPGDAPRRPAPGHDAEAIFEQARRRRKSRQRASAAAISVVLLAGAGIWLTVGGGGGAGAVRGGDSERPAAPTAQSRLDAVAQPAVRLAWIDFVGALNIGDPATGAQHVGPVIDASPAAPLVFAAGRLYWVDARRYAPIREYDIATGKITHLAQGEAVFTSPDGRHVYIIRDDTTLLALPADASGRAAIMRVPAGWYLSGHVYQWFPWEGPVVGGIIVYSSKHAESSPGSVTRVSGIRPPGGCGF